MHDTLLVQGWFFWLVYGVGFAIVAGAVAVLVSALRRPAGDFGRLGRGPWVVLQAVFLVLSALAVVASALKFSSALPQWFATILGVVVILAAIQQIAYLLRVVYPSPRRAMRDDVPDS